MSWRRLTVDGFSGEVFLVESADDLTVRATTRSIEIPTGWHFSRSYRDGIGLLAMGPSRVGVDIEVIDLTVTAAAVLTDTESRLDSGPEDLCRWWSAKEALAKALGDARKYDPRTLDSPALWTTSRQGRWRAQPLEVPAGYIGWIVWETETPA